MATPLVYLVLFALRLFTLQAQLLPLGPIVPGIVTFFGDAQVLAFAGIAHIILDAELNQALSCLDVKLVT
jgi:hypothetical protein